MVSEPRNNQDRCSPKGFELGIQKQLWVSVPVTLPASQRKIGKVIGIALFGASIGEFQREIQLPFFEKQSSKYRTLTSFFHGTHVALG
ncbi:MAG: hypothetical protein OEY63_01175 [Gemmatimonadota bacterium]|nr:hypothetical protein [Gemmatimonadota bacterium]